MSVAWHQIILQFEDDESVVIYEGPLGTFFIIIKMLRFITNLIQF